MTDLYAILRSHQAFCEVSRGRWQLGEETPTWAAVRFRVYPALAGPELASRDALSLLE